MNNETIPPKEKSFNDSMKHLGGKMKEGWHNMTHAVKDMTSNVTKQKPEVDVAPTTENQNLAEKI